MYTCTHVHMATCTHGHPVVSYVHMYTWPPGGVTTKGKFAHLIRPTALREATLWFPFPFSLFNVAKYASENRLQSKRVRNNSCLRTVEFMVAQEGWSPEGEVAQEWRSPEGEVAQEWRSPEGEVAQEWRSPEGEVAQEWRSPEGEVAQEWRSPEGEVAQEWWSPEGEVSRERFYHNSKYESLTSQRPASSSTPCC